MSMALMVKAMCIKVGNPLRKLVLIKLADSASDAGEFTLDIFELALFCECSPIDAKSNFLALEREGFVKRITDASHIPSVFSFSFFGSVDGGGK